MEPGVSKQNSFSRSLANEEKLGAYYTDTEMCRRISKLFRFSQDKEYTVLEPSIGDGTAVMAVTGKEGGFMENVKVFGVEINQNTYDNVISGNPSINYSLRADFLNDVYITNNVFSMVFMNPPYGDDGNGERLETRFLEKASSYLKTGGIMVMVIPSYVFVDEMFSRQYLARYDHLQHFKFDESVYSQFKQVVVVGKKRPGMGFLREKYLKFMESIQDVTVYPYLPQMQVKEPIVVPSVCDSDVKEFTSKMFNADLYYELMKKQSSLYSSVTVGRQIAVEEYSAIELGEPILPPSPSMCYLMATVGGGAGLCGTEGTLHLQRGIAEVVKHDEQTYDEENDKVTIKEVSKTQMSLKIIENDGTITTF